MPSPPIKGKEIKDPFADLTTSGAQAQVGMTSKEVHLSEKKLTSTDVEEGLLGQVEDFKEPPLEVAEFKGAVGSATSDEIDLNDLDESTLLKYPIKAKLLNDAPALIVKPVDPSISFRWVYCGALKTDRQGAINVFQYKKIGFEFATVVDIQGGSEMLVDGMLQDGGMINNFDTVLMKVNKIRLMGHYKANLLRSYDKVNNALKKAKDAAQLQVSSTSAYQKAMQNNPNAVVEFYSPTEAK